MFTIPTKRWSPVRTPVARYKVRPNGAVVPLAAFPLSTARSGIEAVLADTARANAYRRWSVKRQKRAIKQTACRRDDLPVIDSTDLTAYLPFLALDR